VLAGAVYEYLGATSCVDTRDTGRCGSLTAVTPRAAPSSVEVLGHDVIVCMALVIERASYFTLRTQRA
jgi:hypothetical protein